MKGRRKMDIIERYKRAKLIKAKVKRLEKELDNFEYISGIDTTRQNTSDLIDMVIITRYIKQQIKEERQRLNYYIAELLEELDKLDNTEEYDIMFKRYILFKSWEEIEQECRYRISLVLKIHDRALKKLSNKETTL